MLFAIVDNCSSHRGQKASDRLRAKWPTLVLVHTPIHASWLNQIEIYFSIIQRKVLIPNTFASLEELELQILAFQARYNEIAYSEPRLMLPVASMLLTPNFHSRRNERHGMRHRNRFVDA